MDNSRPVSTQDGPMASDAVDKKHSLDSTLTNEMDVTPTKEIPNDEESSIEQNNQIFENMIDKMSIDSLIANIKETFDEVPLTLQHDQSHIPTEKVSDNTQSEPAVMDYVGEREESTFSSNDGQEKIIISKNDDSIHKTPWTKSLEICQTETSVSENMNDDNVKPSVINNKEEIESVSSDQKEIKIAEIMNVDFESNNSEHISPVCVHKEVLPENENEIEMCEKITNTNMDSDTLNMNIAQIDIEEEITNTENSDKIAMEPNVVLKEAQENVLKLSSENRTEVKDSKNHNEIIDNVEPMNIDDEPVISREIKPTTECDKDMLDNIKNIAINVQNTSEQSSAHQILEDNTFTTSIQKEVNDNKNVPKNLKSDVGVTENNNDKNDNDCKPEQTLEQEIVKENAGLTNIENPLENHHLDEVMKDVTESPKPETEIKLNEAVSKESPCGSTQASTNASVQETVQSTEQPQMETNKTPVNTDNIQTPEILNVCEPNAKESSTCANINREPGEINRTPKDNSERQINVEKEISQPTSEVIKRHTIPEMNKETSNKRGSSDSVSFKTDANTKVPLSSYVFKVPAPKFYRPVYAKRSSKELKTGKSSTGQDHPTYSCTINSFLAWVLEHGIFTQDDVKWPYSTRLNEILNIFINNKGVLLLSPIPKTWTHNEIYTLLDTHAGWAGKDVTNCIQCVHFDVSNKIFNTAHLHFKHHFKKIYFTRVMLALQRANIIIEGNRISVKQDGLHGRWSHHDKLYLFDIISPNTSAETNIRHSTTATISEKSKPKQPAGEGTMGTAMNSSPADIPGPRQKQSDKINPFINGVNYNDKATFGLNPAFLQSHNINLPLTSEIMVKNLPLEVTESDVRQVFGYAGIIIAVKIKFSPECGTASVEYDHPLEAVQAISVFNMQEYHGKPLIVHLSLNITTIPPSDDIPQGMTSIGPGLGEHGSILKNVRLGVEIGLVRMLMNWEHTLMGTKVAEIKSHIVNLEAKLKNRENNSHIVTDVNNIVASNVHNSILGILAAQHNQLLQYAQRSQQNVATNLEPPALNWITNPQLNTKKQPKPTGIQSGYPNLKQNTNSNLQVSQNLQAHQNYLNVPQHASAHTNPQSKLRYQVSDMPPDYQIQGYVQPVFGSVQSLSMVQHAHYQPLPVPQYAIPMANPQNVDVRPGKTANFKFVPAAAQPKGPNAPLHPPNAQTVKSGFDLEPMAGVFNIQPVPPLVFGTTQAAKPVVEVAKPPEMQKPQFISTFQEVNTSDAEPRRPIALAPPLIKIKPVKEAYAEVERSNAEDDPLLTRRSNDKSTRRYFDEGSSEESESSDSDINKGYYRERSSRRDYENRDMKRYRERDQRRDSGERDEKRARQSQETQNKDDYDDRTLIIMHLPRSVTTEDLYEKMREIGQVAFVEMKSDSRAEVRFRNISDAENCIQMYHKAKVDNQTIEVRWKY